MNHEKYRLERKLSEITAAIRPGAVSDALSAMAGQTCRLSVATAAAIDALRVNQK